MLLMTSSNTSEQHNMSREDEEEKTSPSKKPIKKEYSNGHCLQSNPSSATAITSTTHSGTNRVQYGAPIEVETSGIFPQAGSILGPYFCLGTLGKGTFSSIHKCINLDYGHRSLLSPSQEVSSSNSSDAATTGALMNLKSNSEKVRLAAAKVELSTFVNSGVLMGEALVLHFLDEALPKGTVPVYLGHYTSGDAAAIVMEYLPGEDMHQLRENRNAQSPTGRAPRRLTIDDAVYLTADVMLPLLQQMHKVGIVHRDVKPSNCVRSKGRKFCMVDFGLSKSIVVPSDSGYADKDHPWPVGQPWLIPPSDNSTTTAAANGDNDKAGAKPQPTHQPGCFRKERTSADFRGTSMYASPRVHQGRDYCPRDDIWSLLYVFCDLVSGGLPWMSHAANRDRDMCQKIKEQVHGLSNNGTNGNNLDMTEKLLMGDDYHVALFKHEQKVEANKDNPDAKTDLSNLPRPLDMSTDKTKIKLLRQAFSHLAKLQFWDQPDYNLIRRCIRVFLDEEGAIGEAGDIEIEWPTIEKSDSKLDKAARKKRKNESVSKSDDLPTWEFDQEQCDSEVENDPLVDSEIFDGIIVAPSPPEGSNNNGVSEPEKAVRRLPLEKQFRIAQMEYHAKNPATALPHIVLQDWMKVAIPLLYQSWDAKAYESGGHRTSTDGYRREHYLELVEKCIAWAEVFHNFSKKEFLGRLPSVSSTFKIEEREEPPLKKRQIVSTLGNSSLSCSTDLASVSKVLFGLKVASKAERAKSFAPPPLLSFGMSR